jgi:hypothetical protein
VLRHPLALAAASALVAGWVLPAFAHQWQDRQKERELKRELATQLDRDTTTAVIAARELIDRRFPEAQTTDARFIDLKAATPSARGSARTAFAAARERERDARTIVYIHDFTSWLVTRSVTRSTLDSYFPGSGLADAWLDYANHITHYIRLAAAGTHTDRVTLIGLLSEYLTGGDDGPWLPLTVTPVPGRAVAKAYGVADGNLSDSLLRRKNEIVKGILAAHAAGFSTRWRDFFADLVP